MLVFNIIAVLKSPVTELAILSFWFNSVYLHTRDAPVVLVGTHCKGVDFSDLRKVSNDIVHLQIMKKVVVVENQKEKLVFYPVDNFLKKKTNEILSS